MMRSFSISRGVRIAALLAVAIFAAACSNNPAIDPTNPLATAATPGSAQDFIVNVGDRVFFESDSTQLTQQSRDTLEKQAQWLTLYNRYAFTIEGHAAEREYL